jgi:Flp pilus assembly protein TadD
MMRSVQLLLLSSVVYLLTIGVVSAQTSRKPRSSVETPPRQTTPSNAQSARSALENIDEQPQITRRQLGASVDPDVLRGYKALQQNQFAQAREAYSQVLAKNATQRDALLGIAYAHQALGDTAQATSTLRRLVELYPRDSDAMSALYLISGGDPQIEESRLKQLLERSERPASLNYALGVLYFEQNRFGEAERAFDRAFSMEPEQPDYAYNLALALDRLGRIRDAMRQYVVALNLANQTSAVFSRDVARSRMRVLSALPTAGK